MKIRLASLLFLVITSVSFSLAAGGSIRLGELDMNLADLERGSVGVDKAPRGEAPIVISGKTYEHGIAMSAPASFLIDLNGEGTRFSAEAGVMQRRRRMPAGLTPPPGMRRHEGNASVRFYVMGDRHLLWESGPLTASDQPAKVDVSTEGIKKLAITIISEGRSGPGPMGTSVALGSAIITYSGDTRPRMISNKVGASSEPSVLTPPEAAAPRINGARVVGARPGNPFLFTVPVTGKKPLKISAEGLPEGLSLDPATGIITGTTPAEGDHEVILNAENKHGEYSRKLIIRAGDLIALTPPLGWNSWNVWGKSVDQDKVKAAADAMAGKLRSHGWTYINIDDGWEAEKRTDDGELLGNEKFPDMKQLADYVHSKGLKIGIYSSPGPTTCGGHLGSYEHEFQDAKTWARWGFDYLKYDWCSYRSIAPDQADLEGLQKPYKLMRAALDSVGRDIVYSLCQYGMGDVWEWGAEVGGNLWRTSGDIRDTWNSLMETGFALSNNSWEFAEPGHWNDPDMLVIGQVGWGPQVRSTGLTPNEQYTHISLWSLQAAPLLIGCDMGEMDEFTLGLLTNDEVLEVNQDPLGRQARRIFAGDGYQVWAKDMEDGSIAAGIFYTGNQKAGTDNPADLINWDNRTIEPKTITVKWDQLDISGKQRIRDLWRQEDLGEFSGAFATTVSYHGVTMIRLTPVD